MSAVNVPTQTITSSDVPNPIDNSTAWTTYTINGTPCPGIVATDGVRGFERKTTWDLKIGKGTGGAINTLATAPPAEGSITSWLWTSDHFDAWDMFSSLLEYHSDKQPNTQASNINYPALAYNDITQVVVHSVGIPRHLGKQLYSVTVEFIEWIPPPKTTIVSTPIQPGATFADIPGDATPEQAALSSQLAQTQATFAALGATQSAISRTKDQ